MGTTKRVVGSYIKAALRWPVFCWRFRCLVPWDVAMFIPLRQPPLTEAEKRYGQKLAKILGLEPRPPLPKDED